MKKKKQLRLRLSILLLAIVGTVQAQTLFQVRDSLTSEPVADAIVSVFAQQKLLQSTVSNRQGICKLKWPKEADRMHISRLNYYVKQIALHTDTPFPQIVLLSPKVTKEVVVQGSIETNGIDKDTYLVTDSLRKGVMFAADMLGRLPGMLYNWYDNSLSLNGDKNILLLVDGIEKRQDYIKNINPQRIKKVEITRNPGGRYLSENYAAVVNLELYEDYVGWDLLAGNEARVFADRLNRSDWLFDERPSLDMTYTRNRFTVHGYYGYGRKRVKALEESYSNYPGIIENQTISTDGKSPNVSIDTDDHTLVLGVDYQLSKQHTLSMEVQYKQEGQDGDMNYLVRSRKYGEAEFDEVRSAMQLGTKSHDYVAALFYKGKIGKRWQLYSDLNYNYYTNNRDITSWQENWYSLSNRYSGMKNYLRFNADATYQFNDKVNLKFGYNVAWKEYTNENRQTGVQESSSDNYRHRLFAYYSHLFSSAWRFSAGMSTEWIRYENKGLSPATYFAAMPDVKLMFIPHKRLNMTLQYLASVSYPTLEQTVSSTYQTNGVAAYRGNPALKQAQYHNLSLQTRLWNCLTVTPTFSYTKGGIYAYCYQADGQVISTYVNANTRNYGFTVNYGRLFFKSLYFSGNVKFDRTEVDYHEISRGVNAWTGTGMLMYINQKNGLRLMLQYDHRYSKALLSLQGEHKSGTSMFMLAAMKNFMKNRLSVMVGYVPPVTWDAFKDSKSSMNLDFYQSHRTNPEFDIIKNMVMVRLNYRFSKGKRTKKADNKVTVDKETIVNLSN